MAAKDMRPMCILNTERVSQHSWSHGSGCCSGCSCSTKCRTLVFYSLGGACKICMHDVQCPMMFSACSDS
jgi:hypothetical protein